MAEALELPLLPDGSATRAPTIDDAARVGRQGQGIGAALGLGQRVDMRVIREFVGLRLTLD